MMRGGPLGAPADTSQSTPSSPAEALTHAFTTLMPNADGGGDPRMPAPRSCCGRDDCISTIAWASRSADGRPMPGRARIHPPLLSNGPAPAPVLPCAQRRCVDRSVCHGQTVGLCSHFRRRRFWRALLQQQSWATSPMSPSMSATVGPLQRSDPSCDVGVRMPGAPIPACCCSRVARHGRRSDHCGQRNRQGQLPIRLVA